MSVRTCPATVGLALVVALAGCGGDEEQTVGSPSSPASSAPVQQECPTTPVEVPAPEAATTDMSVQPVVAGSSEPPPEQVEVADIVEGDGEEAAPGSQVEVKYVGAFYETGQEFDSSWSQSPDTTLPFGVCEPGVIEGFSVAPVGMKAGGRRQVTIPSEYGYGEEGVGPIPPGATLVFVIDLVTVS